MILHLHNRYRTTGGEERVVEDLLWLTRERLGEEAELLARDSALLGRGRAAVAMLRGGLAPDDVAAAVRRSGATIVHAHNVNPSYGWRALAAARAAGARTVAHLHNYRLVCAVAVCFTRGAECTRCHGRNTLPGVLLACRGSRAESSVYGAGLALWQRRLAAQVDLFVVPSESALRRLRALGAPLSESVAVVGGLVRDFAEDSLAAAGGHALVASRLAPEKGVDIAIEAAGRARVPLVIAGEGPSEAQLREAARGLDVRFEGRVSAQRLTALRRGAALAIVPSRSAETFGLAVAEAMAAGVPVVASRIGALPELLEPDGLVAPGDTADLAAAIGRRYGDSEAGRRGIGRVRELAGPERVADKLRGAYESVRSGP